MMLFVGLITTDSSAQQVHYHGSIQFASGKYYFGETSQSMYLNNGVSVSYSKVHIGADLPYVLQNTPWISYSSVGGIATGGPQHGAVSQHTGKGQKGRRTTIEIPDTASYTQSGFSDPTVNIRYDIFTSYNKHQMLSLTSAAKIPFAEPDMGFGTGEWDFSVGASFVSRTQNWFWNANAAYWYFGDLPELVLKEALSYGIGVGRSFVSHTLMTFLTFQGMTKVIGGTEAPLSTGVGLSYKVGPNATLSTNMAIGISEAMPDYSLGIGWNITVN